MTRRPLDRRLARRPLDRRLARRQRVRRAGAPGGLPVGVLLLMGGAVGVLVRLTLFIRQREASQFTQVDAAATVEIALVGLTGGLILVMPAFLQRVWKRLAGTSGAAWLLLFAVGVLSTLWSVNPAYSGFRSVEVLTQVLALFVILAHAGPFAAAERLTLRLGWLAVLLSVASALILSRFALSGARSNTFSAGAAMVASYSFGALLEGRGRGTRRMWVSFAAALALVVFGLSLGSWWAALAGMAAALWWGRARRVLALLPLVGLLCVAFWGDELVAAVVLRNRPLEEVVALHGRVALWEHYWGFFQDRPLLGYGFAIAARELGPVYATNTHNAFMSVLLGCGVVGALVLVGVVGAYALELVRARRAKRTGNVASLAFGVTALINSMSLGFFGESWTPATFILTCFFALHVLHVAGPREVGRGAVRRRPARRRALPEEAVCTS